MKSIRLAVAAMVALVPLAVASPAQAAQPQSTTAASAPGSRQFSGQAPQKIICHVFPWLCQRD